MKTVYWMVADTDGKFLVYLDDDYQWTHSPYDAPHLCTIKKDAETLVKYYGGKVRKVIFTVVESED